MHLNKVLVRKIVKEALGEDAADRDITTLSFIQDGVFSEASIVAKEDGVVCGVDIACETFRLFDRDILLSAIKKDGQPIKKKDIILKARGSAKSILSCERVALNFLTYLSGISTSTSEAVKKVNNKGIKILDTRKTTPTLRVFEKYAVLAGGGNNHRFDLSSQYLLKENHQDIIKKTSGSEVLLWRKSGVPFEIEVQDLDELSSALGLGPDIVMLDNFSPKDIKAAVTFLKKIFPDKEKRPLLELSGGITPENISSFAIRGVDFISLGALTHSTRALDMSLDITKIYTK